MQSGSVQRGQSAASSTRPETPTGNQQSQGTQGNIDSSAKYFSVTMIKIWTFAIALVFAHCAVCLFGLNRVLKWNLID